MVDDELTPLGRALEGARGAVSKREAARRAGISEGRWRQIVTGRQSVGGGLYVPAKPRRETVISMADAVKLDVNEALALAGFDAQDQSSPAEDERAAGMRAVLAALAADPNLSQAARDHITNQYRILVDWSGGAGVHPGRGQPDEVLRASRPSRRQHTRGHDKGTRAGGSA